MIKKIMKFFSPPNYDKELEELDKNILETKKSFDDAIATLDGESQWFIRKHIEETRKKWELNKSES